MEKITSPMALCCACRNVFVGGDAIPAAGCPACGSSCVVFVIDPSALVDAYENSTALESLCALSGNEDDFEHVANIMGIDDGCTQRRDDSSCMDALADWMSENGL